MYSPTYSGDIKQIQEVLNTIWNEVRIIRDKLEVSDAVPEQISLHSTIYGEEGYRYLNDICFEFSNEGYDIVFDPNKIQQYFNRYPKCFEGAMYAERNFGKKTRFFAKKEKLLDALVGFNHQTALQKKLFGQFRDWRKNKNEKMEQDIGQTPT